MEQRQNGQIAERQNGQDAERQNGQVAERQNGQVAPAEEEEKEARVEVPAEVRHASVLLGKLMERPAEGKTKDVVGSWSG